VQITYLILTDWGISDSFEQGKSLTLGVDFKKESLENINKYFEFKLAGVIRDKTQKNIPTSSSINPRNFKFIWDSRI
jgi:LPS-assembly protein